MQVVSLVSEGSGQIGQSGLFASGQVGSYGQVVSVMSVGSGQIGHAGLLASGQVGS